MIKAHTGGSARDIIDRRAIQDIHDNASALGASCLPKRRPVGVDQAAFQKASPDDADHPGWPAGTPDGAGGEFRPKEKAYILPLDQIAPDAKEHPVQLTDTAGKPILDGRGNAILYPAHLEPAFFVKRGLAMREKLEGEKLLSQYGNFMPIAALLPDLIHFKQGGDWDAQRIGGKNVKEYQDYATIAIGLYAAAANVPLDEILSDQDSYAQVRSHFDPQAPMDSVYTHLRQKNVENTRFGYEPYRSGRISSGGR